MLLDLYFGATKLESRPHYRLSEMVYHILSTNSDNPF
jgi:hypothetical protein